MAAVAHVNSGAQIPVDTKESNGYTYITYKLSDTDTIVRKIDENGETVGILLNSEEHGGQALMAVDRTKKRIILSAPPTYSIKDLNDLPEDAD